MKIELEMSKDEFNEFIDILDDMAHHSGQDLPVLEHILGQLLEINTNGNLH